MAVSLGRFTENERDILSKISEEDILYFYLGIRKLPIVIHSPLRKDANPSFGLYYSSGGKIRFKDFATGERGSLIELLMRYLNKTFPQVLEDIYYNLDPLSTIAHSLKYKKEYKPSSLQIKVKIRPWKEWDKEYWSSYGISKKFLEFSRTFPISHIFLYKEDGSVTTITADKYSYAYFEFKDGIPTYKIYQPFSTSLKWINKHTSDVWDLWEQLPKEGDILIITSSRKDAMCIWHNTGIPSTCLQAESFLPKESVINELKNRFKSIFVLYDNDFTKKTNWGREYGKAFSEAFNIPQIELPEELGAKDSSDLYKLRGKTILRETIFNLTHYEKD